MFTQVDSSEIIEIRIDAFGKYLENPSKSLSVRRDMG
jgi:hypothetical protein